MGVLTKVVPEAIWRQPFELLLAFMGTVSSVSTLTGVSNSNALDRVLPHWFIATWALTLLIGCMALFCGATSIKEVDGRLIVRRVACYRLGLRLLGGASLVYGTTLLLAAGTRALTAAPIILAFSLACYLRHADITERTNQ